MEKGDQPQTRRDRRIKEREAQRAKLKAGPTATRREFIQALTPGGWIKEAIRVAQGKQEGISRAAAASAVKDVALVGGIPLAVNLLGREQKDSRPLKEKVLSFTWKDADNPEKLKRFVEDLADNYLKLTGTPRLKKENLTEKDQTNFYKDRDSFIEAVKKVKSDYLPKSTEYGYADHQSKKVFIDIDLLKRQALAQDGQAGVALIDTLWHEWGHLDITSRETGEYVNNPRDLLAPTSKNKPEIIKGYYGGTMYSDNYRDYLQFDEVWNETITTRRIIEQVGLEHLTAQSNYYEAGTDFFPKFTYAANISLKTLYQMHATSDFEGFAKLIGHHLPGFDPDFVKGEKLFKAITNRNIDEIKQTGALDVISRK